jgi:hypothetical protein
VWGFSNLSICLWGISNLPINLVLFSVKVVSKEVDILGSKLVDISGGR